MTHGTSDAILDRMMALHPKVIDLTLDRMWRLLDRLGNPQDRLPPVIHVAGTNGKGSTLAMLRAGLEAEGRRCHVYTSPHLARFHERIRLAGELISEAALTEILDECYVANGDRAITYFEITTAAALLAFARIEADYTLLEVGLGGRLDATNVIKSPVLTCITPVSLDHQQFLGETIPEIAGEKAGILKRGVPCVVSAQSDEALQVIEDMARRVGAPLLVQNQQWHVWEERKRLIFQDENGLRDLPMPSLIGAHQVQNAGAALMGLRQLGFGDAAFEGAVTNVTWPARMQRLTQGPLIDAWPQLEFWLDGGHNPACAHTIVESLSRLPTCETHLVCGLLNTKDVAGYLAPLVPHVAGLQAVVIPGEANTVPAPALAEKAQSLGIAAKPAESVAGAVDEVGARGEAVRVLICGSLYLAGFILRHHG